MYGGSYTSVISSSKDLASDIAVRLCTITTAATVTPIATATRAMNLYAFCISGSLGLLMLMLGL